MPVIRGLMWGSPEFEELARTGETRGELDGHIETIYETLSEISEFSEQLTETQRRDLRIIMMDIFEMVGE